VRVFNISVESFDHLSYRKRSRDDTETLNVPNLRKRALLTATRGVSARWCYCYMNSHHPFRESIHLLKEAEVRKQGH
jgi:hypothetical protein